MLRYSPRTLLILLGMIVTGAARIVSVKLFYQMGFKSPLTVTLLYLTGQALSLLVYAWQQRQQQQRSSAIRINKTQHHTTKEGFATVSMHDFDQYDDDDNSIVVVVEEDEEQQQQARRSPPGDDEDCDEHKEDEEAPTDEFMDETKCCSSSKSLEESHLELTHLHHRSHHDDDDEEDKSHEEMALCDDVSSSSSSFSSVASSNTRDHHSSSPHKPRRQGTKRRRGSFTGLTAESSQHVQRWVRRIPWYLQPTIPAIFNLCNSSMRLASLVFVPASLAELLIAGMELTGSVVAARVIRRRNVSTARWTGVAVVTAGLLLVGLADVVSVEQENNHVPAAVTKGSGDDLEAMLVGDGGTAAAAAATSQALHDQFIGLLLIVGQTITSVLQDIAEEIFMDESDFEPTLLLGMEGLQGLVMGAFLYVPLTRLVGEAPPAETLASLTLSSPTNNNNSLGWYAVYLTLLFCATGICNISATAVTSSMTRNVWKNLRTLLVWVMGLLIGYGSTIFMASSSDPQSPQLHDLGETWRMPESLIVPAGSVVMFFGIWLYYLDK